MHQNTTHQNFSDLTVELPVGLVYGYGYVIILQLFAMTVFARFSFLLLVCITVYVYFNHVLDIVYMQTQDQSALVGFAVVNVTLVFHFCILAMKCRKLKNVQDTNVTIEPV